jgi:hypothetical protein
MNHCSWYLPCSLSSYVDGLKRNIGYTHVGIALIVKIKVAFKGTKKKNIGRILLLMLYLCVLMFLQDSLN